MTTRTPPAPLHRSCPPLSATADGELLARTSRGDERAFEVLYHRHVAACARRARHVLASDEWLEDVVQAVFLDVWTHAARFDRGRGGVRPWLLGLAHHKAVDLVRAQERHRVRRAHEELLEGHVDAAPTPKELAADADAGRQLRAAVAGVAAPQREVVELCFLAGLSQREAAARLGIPLGTVKTRSRRAVLELGRTLDPGLRRPA